MKDRIIQAGFLRQKSVSSAHENNFDAIRLIAALTVILGHSWGLTGHGPGPSFLGIPLETIAVWVFFSLSGYLVGSSWKRDPNALRFLARRLARIIPGLFLVVLTTTLILGPLVTTLSADDYFGSPRTWQYLTNLTTVASYQLPGVFENLARPVVNGSLWTLGPEFMCYLLVLVVGLLAIRVTGRGSAKIATSMFAVLALCLAAVVIFAPNSLGTWEPSAQAAVFFMTGAIYTHVMHSRQTPMLIALVGIIAWTIIGTLFAGTSAYIAWVVLPVVVLAVGERSTPILRRTARFGDLSYGCYLWGYPIQQTVAYLVPDAPLWASVLLTLAVVIPMASISWHLVERPCLQRVRSANLMRVATFRAAPVSRSSSPTVRPTQRAADIIGNYRTSDASRTAGVITNGIWSKSS